MCSMCTCSWLGCTSPRKWGKHCTVHSRKLGELSTTWQLVIAAGALNCELVPADALGFSDFYVRHRTSFRECLTIAFVKEPQATTMFDEELSALGACPSKDDLRKAWMRVIERVIDCGQDKEALRNLTRQGVGRMSCLARAMTMIGIIECAKAGPSPSTVAGGTFALGLDNRKYRFCKDKSQFDAFYDAFYDISGLWPKFLHQIDNGLQQFDLGRFCKELRVTLHTAANARRSFKHKSQKKVWTCRRR